MTKAIEALMGEKVIVRSDRAGVFYGTLDEVEALGDKYCVTLTKCRRLWYWDGAASLSQLANEGVKKPEDCNFTVVVESISVMGVIEIIPTTVEAQRIIEGVKVWKV